MTKLEKRSTRIGSKLYVGFNKKELKSLLTDTCKKCKHLIDDHLKPMSSKSKYVCKHCGCKI